MSKKYSFDNDNFDYQKDKKSTMIIKTILTNFVGIVFLSIAVFLGLSYFTDTPQEKSLKHQNIVIEQEYDKLIVMYQKNEKNLQILEQQDFGLYQLMFGKEPASNYASNVLENYQDIRPIDLAKQNTKKLEELTSKYSANRKDFDDFIVYFEAHKENINNIPSIQPVPNSNLKLLLYGFGERLDPVYHTPDFHSGLDFNAPSGTPVFATADGVVSTAGKGKREYGKVVEINHGDYTTIYHHLREVDTRKGKSVKKGEVIGYVGTTGKSLISHLHYEVRYKGTPVNPIFFFFLDISPKGFREIYKQSTRAGISLD